MADSSSIVALVVSLVALVVAFAQAVQQYAAIASDYRLCSAKTVGGWARLSHRHFIWSEFRFEVKYTAPKIAIHPRTSYYMKSPPIAPATTDDAEKSSSRLPKMVSTSRTERLERRISKQYRLVARRAGKWIRSMSVFGSDDSPWFLSSKGTIPEGKCSWLTLLEDTVEMDLDIFIAQRESSYDFKVDGSDRPLARMDKISFLTLLSLMRIRWNGDDDLTGACDHCEITSRKLVNFGIVYNYHHLDSTDIGMRYERHVSETPTETWQCVTSERARAAMFHKFDLGFAVFLTQTPEEIFDSLLELVGQDVARTVESWHRGSNGWSPGLCDVIACWAEPSMPKVIDEAKDSFISVFSAQPANGVFGDSPVVKMLCRRSVFNATSETHQIYEWAEDFFAQVRDILSAPGVVTEVNFAASTSWDTNNMFQTETITWSRSKRCLALVQALDNHLEELLGDRDPTSKKELKKDFARNQVRFGANIHTDSTAKAGEGCYWKDQIPAVVARNYVNIANEITSSLDGNSELAQTIVLNRMVRAVLWIIHNGNAPDQLERKGECSLNSRWLTDRSTVYIA